jgi:hypothetical protein
MKKLIILFLTIMMPIMVGAQAQITTKKAKLEDFTQKVTKIVLNGNQFYDTSLTDEVTTRWRISPYEFCTLDEFEKLKSNDQYYFLMLTQGQFRKETAPGLMFLSLVKGGKGADKGIDGMLEVVSLPFASSEYPSGREIVFLPAFLDIIQNYVQDAMKTDFNAYGGLANATKNIHKAGKMTIVFSEDDLNSLVSQAVMDRYFDEDMTVTDEDSADQLLLDNAANTLVSYVAVPSEPINGSFCYKMLIDSQTHKLFYFRKHKISSKAGSGFLPEDIIKITAPRAKKTSRK